MRRTVAVVGGGCSGVLVAREVLRGGDDVALIEPGQLGGGVAYGGARPWHLLNSRAGAMSAVPGDPGHFLRWSGASPGEFRPRAEYGRYLRSVLAEADQGRLRWFRTKATGVDPEGTVALADGTRVRADHVVLALGGPRAAEQRLPHPAVIDDPWQPGVLEALPPDRPVLLVGTGLTAVDAALTLTADGRRTAPVVAVSRRGLLPLTHTADAAPPEAPDLADCATLREVIRAVRAAAGAAGDWRPVVDGLRPYLDRIWTALTPEEQEAFLRHLARTWECHRHRMAPQIAERVVALRQAGLLEIRRGGVAAWPGLAGYAAVVNCAGPGRLPDSAHPLVRELLDSGQAQVGPHALGLAIDPAGRLVAADGRVHERLWLLGPLRRGTQWETTAVPELRDQAHRLAADLHTGAGLAAAA
ncbi:FAD/NAD(P)-binding protein [Actinoplanes sp. N902-109]|uniref:FAD/NAD(P)-binding protein n=1 Tax=Actinoplanes sp. (strain N902-109) TaxID=649831 RepID=UPI00032963EA|nr:FAD/NAD(P)-binding protein [Actinoplanes sp. N902-109]AGL19888.1 FAD dependent oxidoreductase [Actinoplanes sp. N902-109]